jgi:hypothetical protein
MTNEYSVDDRGNMAQFYSYEDECIVATLHREAGQDACSLSWDGDDDVTQFAIDEGYGDEIELAERV